MTRPGGGAINAVMPAFFLDPIFFKHETGNHPECPERLRVIARALGEEPLGAPAPDREAVLRVHDPRYVGYVELLSENGGGYLTPDTPFSRASYRAALTAASTVCAAVDAVMERNFSSAFCAVRPPGHHATPSRGMGFCLFNNIAVAAMHAKHRWRLERILIVDWDVHHGNGTQAAFEADPEVFYLSLHLSPHYPYTGKPDERGTGEAEGTVLNVPLAEGTGPDEYLSELENALAEASGFRPELVLVSCGFDGLAGDPLGGMRLDAETFAEATRLVRRAAGEAGPRPPPIVSSLEGGYLLDRIGGAARAHFEALP